MTLPKNKFILLSFVFFVGLHHIICAQKEVGSLRKISGFIEDAKSGEALVGATLVSKTSKNGVVSDHKGYFSGFFMLGDSIEVSSVGYTKEIRKIKPDSSFLYIRLEPNDYLLSPVTIEGIPLLGFNLNKTRINTNFIQKLPSISGKPDILKSLALTPGISMQSEISGMIMVRGGDVGDNLYLLDNIPLHYVYHLGGFFSVFNPDMVNTVEVYKGGFTPNYGGRLSSYIDIIQKKGDKSEIKGNLNIGISDISFAVEGPVTKKSSFIVTGRKTLIDLLMMLITGTSLSGNNYMFFYGFHDINAKYSWMPNPKNSIDFNIYYGDDYLNYTSIGGGDKNNLRDIWGNILLSGTWKKSFKNNLFGATSVSFSRYRLNTANHSVNRNYKRQSALQELTLFSDWKYNVLPPWDIDFGLKTNWTQHIPQKVSETIDGVEKKHPQTIQNAADIAFYFHNKLKLFSFVNLQLGLRVDNYLIENKNLFSLEPRILLHFTLGRNHILGINYTKTSQNTQLILVDGTIMNKQIWVSSDRDIPTAIADQYNIAWNAHFFKHLFEIEAALYYKQMKNLSTLKDGYTSLSGDSYWKEKIASYGIGKAFGFEFSFKKTSGRVTGILSYSYSRSFRQFDEVNNGKTYVFELDRPHQANLAINWQLTKKWNISAVWIYQTGSPYTPVVDRIYVPNTDNIGNGVYEILVYGERNSSRMKDYHRLDIGAQYNYTTKRGRRACWSFSIYNVYNRANPAIHMYKQAGESNFSSINYNPKYASEFQQLGAYQISYFPVMPMVSYKIWFHSK